MKRLLLALLFVMFVWSSAAMAADLIPADRLTDWTPGVTVGVPGGIPSNRTHLIDVTRAPYNADNNGATDAQPAIMKAIADAKDKDVVYLPAGKYRIDKSITIARGKSNFTLRGAGPNQTVIRASNQSHVEITPADGGDWWYPKRLKLDILDSPKKGTTVLTVSDTKALDAYPNGGIGQICQLRAEKRSETAGDGYGEVGIPAKAVVAHRGPDARQCDHRAGPAVRPAGRTGSRAQARGTLFGRRGDRGSDRGRDEFDGVPRAGVGQHERRLLGQERHHAEGGTIHLFDRWLSTM